MGHDQLFKALLESFLREFMELFFPDVAERLDFQSQRLVDKELFTDFPEGRLREADVVVELQTREGNPEILLVHVEVQAGGETDFGKRMFGYYSMLRLRYQMPVFPVVLYLKGGPSGEVAEYRDELFGWEVVRFRYASVGLARLSVQEYVEASPLAAALSALMRRGRSADALELRARMLKRVVESSLDEARQYLLVNVIETYFPLSGVDLERFREVAARKEFAKVQDTDLTWGDKLLLEGALQGKRETLKRQVAAKFGPLPTEVATRIDEVVSAEELDQYLDRVLAAESLDDIGLATN